MEGDRLCRQIQYEIGLQAPVRDTIGKNSCTLRAGPVYCYPFPDLNGRFSLLFLFLIPHFFQQPWQLFKNCAKAFVAAGWNKGDLIAMGGKESYGLNAQASACATAGPFPISLALLVALAFTAAITQANPEFNNRDTGEFTQLEGLTYHGFRLGFRPQKFSKLFYCFFYIECHNIKIYW